MATVFSAREKRTLRSEPHSRAAPNDERVRIRERGFAGQREDTPDGRHGERRSLDVDRVVNKPKQGARKDKGGQDWTRKLPSQRQEGLGNGTY
jgi:hypothetical protein